MARIKPFCYNCGHLLSDHRVSGWCNRCDFNILREHRARHPDTTLEECKCNCCGDLQSCTQFIEVEDVVPRWLTFLYRQSCFYLCESFK